MVGDGNTKNATEAIFFVLDRVERLEHLTGFIALCLFGKFFIFVTFLGCHQNRKSCDSSMETLVLMIFDHHGIPSLCRDVVAIGQEVKGNLPNRSHMAKS